MERFFNNIGNTFSESLADLGRQFHPQNGQRQAGQPPPIHSNSNNNNNRPQAAHDKPPPASRRYILGLAENPVTSDDVIEVRGPVGGCTHQMEVNNKECLICLDDHEIGCLACKLPCGHLYHKGCISEWLAKHCTCPVCRYEVECNDLTYERGRQQRMASTRRPRMREDELKKTRIPELRRLSNQLGVDISRCIDKSEIVDRIIASNKIQIVEGVPMMEIEEDVWASKSVKQLRQLLKDYGISDEDALYKDDLRNRLLESGRITIVPNSNSKSSDAMAGTMDVGVDHSSDAKATNTMDATEEGEGASNAQAKRMKTSDGDDKDAIQEKESSSGAALYADIRQPSANIATPATAAPQSDVLELGTALLSTLAVRELKDIMKAFNISSENCLERQDLVERLRNSDKVRIIDD